MSAIERCRTAALGGHIEQCDRCGHQRITYNSCRHRTCPKCQSLARAQWLEDRQAELLNGVEYFHVVFTVPEPIAAMAFQNKTLVYDLLFHASAETLRTIAVDPQHLGAEIGFISILHTWGQQLLHHPHVHCVVPGGGPCPRRPALDRLPARLLPARARAVPTLPPIIPRAVAPCVPGGRAALLCAARTLTRRPHLRRLSSSGRANRVGGLCQAALRRRPPCARLSRPLHPSRGDLQQPPAEFQTATASRFSGRTTNTARRKRP